MNVSIPFGGSKENQRLVLGHPSGLFVLFFTEMWERFSYYGMRALFILFLTSSLMDGGFGWPAESALALYGTYTAMVYLTPILGGFLADRFMGYRWAVVVGAFIMTLGHAALAAETPFFLYLGLFFLVLGNGFFKPNMTSIISEMYTEHEEKKDGAFTIYYMGVNAGAFLGIMLCGYIGEKVGWSWGFGLAGIFMFFGMLQFYFTQGIFGKIGLSPKNRVAAELTEEAENKSAGVVKPEPKTLTAEEQQAKADTDKRNPFTPFDLALTALVSILGLLWIVNDPMSKISGLNLFDFQLMGMDGSNFIVTLALVLFIFLIVSRLIRYTTVVRDRMIAVVIFAFFTVFFWAAFEQAGGSMTLFARDFTNRVLLGSSATVFTIFNTLLTLVPLGIITWVLILLFKNTFSHYKWGNIFLGTSFAIIWGIVIWMLYLEINSDVTEVTASWFGILNSFFIIAFAPLFSKLWESKYNPSAAVKYGLGMILLGIGFGALAFGASTIPAGAAVAKVSMIWLILAYLFHTLGELCLSPVGLSYVSKLVPGRMIGMMFGIWYLAIAIGNKTAGSVGGMIEQISEEYSMAGFFLLFTAIPIVAGLLATGLHPVIKRLMHGIN